MTPPLSPELEQRIEEEAEEAATVRAWTQEDHAGNKTIHRPYVNGIRKEFYKKGAIPYAELWQQSEQRMSTLISALEQISNAPYPENDNERLSWILTARNLAQQALKPIEDIISDSRDQPTPAT